VKWRPSGSFQVGRASLKLVIAVVVGLLLIAVLESWAKALIPLAVNTKWSKPVPMRNVNFLCHWNGSAVAIGSGGVFRILNEAGQWEEKTVAELEPAENGSCLRGRVSAVYFGVRIGGNHGKWSPFRNSVQRARAQCAGWETPFAILRRISATTFGCQRKPLVQQIGRSQHCCATR